MPDATAEEKPEPVNSVLAGISLADRLKSMDIYLKALEEIGAKDKDGNITFNTGADKGDAFFKLLSNKDLRKDPYVNSELERLEFAIDDISWEKINNLLEINYKSEKGERNKILLIDAIQTIKQKGIKIASHTPFVHGLQMSQYPDFEIIFSDKITNQNQANEICQALNASDAINCRSVEQTDASGKKQYGIKFNQNKLPDDIGEKLSKALDKVLPATPAKAAAPIAPAQPSPAPKESAEEKLKRYDDFIAAVEKLGI